MFRSKLKAAGWLSILASLCLLFCRVEIARAEEGVWSRHAFLLPAQGPFRVPSPDRSKTVFVEGTALTVLDGGQRCSGLEGYSLLGQAELAWSPDSKAFVITASEGGQEGPWFITVFQVQSGKVTVKEPTGEVIEKMHERYPCLGQEDPDLGAVWWIKEGSSRLLIAAEVPAGSACGENRGRRGYIIDVSTGKIQYDFDALQLKEEFAEHLGARLMRPLRP